MCRLCDGCGRISLKSTGIQKKADGTNRSRPFTIALRCRCHRTEHCRASCGCNSSYMPYLSVDFSSRHLLDSVRYIRCHPMALVGGSRLPSLAYRRSLSVYLPGICAKPAVPDFSRHFRLLPSSGRSASGTPAHGPNLGRVAGGPVRYDPLFRTRTIQPRVSDLRAGLVCLRHHPDAYCNPARSVSLPRTQTAAFGSQTAGAADAASAAFSLQYVECDHNAGEDRTPEGGGCNARASEYDPQGDTVELDAGEDTAVAGVADGRSLFSNRTDAFRRSPARGNEGRSYCSRRTCSMLSAAADCGECHPAWHRPAGTRWPDSGFCRKKWR